METSEFYVPREFYISAEYANKIVNVIKEKLPCLDASKQDKNHLDVIKCRVSKDDFGDNYLEDLLVCHYIFTVLGKLKGFKDKYYFWVETDDSDKFPKFKTNQDITTPVGEVDTLGRIRFGQVITVCVRLKSTMLERIKYNMELGVIQYNSINNFKQALKNVKETLKNL